MSIGMKVNILFTSLPNGEAQKIARTSTRTHVKLIDLSADFRLDDL